MIIYPNVAGKFYPQPPNELRQKVQKLLAQAKNQATLPTPKSIIAPHAGYDFSGPIAATAYSVLTQIPNLIKRVVILAPSHHFPLIGVATTKAQHYLTPLGKIEIEPMEALIKEGLAVTIIDEAFKLEHSLEVQLPFLQLILAKFKLIPLLVGHATSDLVSNILAQLWNGPSTLIIISSDLSHYHPYLIAQTIDQKTASAIETLNTNGFTSEDACGSIAIKGMLQIAAQKNMQVTQVDLRNSGDTFGNKESVVGYGAFHFR